ncbi:unnamed protein product [Trichogramma brassicae]|uniref:Uncharacterized protein n=1 Tax=Trichogramma brassicae TaxID=86971 RepID=A0A6H5IQP8_9HYME|nr:unnamed protein product [Trichogramma brassicae]
MSRRNYWIQEPREYIMHGDYPFASQRIRDNSACATREINEALVSATGEPVLLFPRSTLFQFVVAASTPIAQDKKGSLVLNTGFQFNYAMPWNLTQLGHPTPVVHARNSRQVRQEPERQPEQLNLENVYLALENALEEHGWGDGRSCLLRSICEHAEAPIARSSTYDSSEHDVVEEIVHLLLTPSEEINDRESQWSGGGNFTTTSSSSSSSSRASTMIVDYLEAEIAGRSRERGHCRDVYGLNCPESPLEIFTELYDADSMEEDEENGELRRKKEEEEAEEKESMKRELVAAFLQLLLGLYCCYASHHPPPLVYPNGGILKLLIGGTLPIAMPNGRIVVYGHNIQYQFNLPANASLFGETPKLRKRRAVSNEAEEDERGLFYRMVEHELERRGRPSKDCLKRSICESAETPLRDDGLLGEIFHVLLTCSGRRAGGGGVGGVIGAKFSALSLSLTGLKLVYYTRSLSSRRMCVTGVLHTNEEEQQQQQQRRRRNAGKRICSSSSASSAIHPHPHSHTHTHRMYGVLRLLLLLLVAAVAVGVTSGAQRHRRFVAFGKGSTFAYRLNYKVPLFKNNTILYQASGFKAAWQLPEKSDNYKLQKPQPQPLKSRRRWSNSGGHRRRRIGSRDIRDTMHDLYESNIQVVYCLTIGAEGRPDGDLVLGLTAALAYELPSGISDDAINDVDDDDEGAASSADDKLDRRNNYNYSYKNRKKNVLHRRSRAAVYPKIEAFLQS